MWEFERQADASLTKWLRDDPEAYGTDLDVHKHVDEFVQIAKEWQACLQGRHVQQLATGSWDVHRMSLYVDSER